MQRELTQSIIEDWVKLADGLFRTRDICADLNIESSTGKSHLRVILKRLVESGLIAHGKEYGSYRKVDTSMPEVNWQEADPENDIPFKLPFNMNDYVRVYRKNIIILAGEKDAGKSRFLHNLAVANMNAFPVDLYVTQENGPEDLAERLGPFKVPTPSPFKVFERYDAFADVLHPDHVSIIDYLDLNSEIYLVGKEIDDISRKLRNGLAVIGLQKPISQKVLDHKTGKEKIFERDLAYGSGFSAKRASLYLSIMNGNKLKIVFAKKRRRLNVDPKNMTWEFKIDPDGAHMTGHRFEDDNPNE